MDNSADNDDTTSDVVSPIDTRHLRLAGMVVLTVMLFIIVAVVAGVIAQVTR